jgi:DNA mismatch endonuclease (patch repair protein)
MTQPDEAPQTWKPPPGSWASSEGNRRSMLGNRGRDTGPEWAVRSLIHRAGLRYRVDVRPVTTVRRRADLVFPRLKIAVFIDGCFWHACPQHFAWPKTNSEYWERKIGGNQLRDTETNLALEEHGWTVLRFWAHEPADDIARQLHEAVLEAKLLLSSDQRKRRAFTPQI